MTGDTMRNNIDQNISPGVIVLTLAVLAIVFMVGFHLMSRADSSSTLEPVRVSGGLVHSSYDEVGTAPKTSSR